MEQALVGIQIVLTLFFMIALGVVFAWRGKFGDKTNELFTFLVTKVGLPAMVISNMVNYYSRADILSSLVSLLIPLITMPLNYVLAQGLARLIRLPKNRMGVFCAMFTFSNTMFIGLPVNVALFGEETIPFTLLYYVSQQLIFWTVGVGGIQKDGDPSLRIFSARGLKKLLSVPLISFFIGLILVLVEFTPPQFLMDSAKYIAGLVTPLSMFFTGTILYSIGLKNVRIDKSLVLMCIGRFLISPALVFLLTRLIPIPAMTLRTFLVQASMPIMTQTAILAKAYGGDSEYATVGTLLTTLLSIVFIPLYAYLGTLI